MRNLFHRKHKYVVHRYKDFVVEVCRCGDYFKRHRTTDEAVAEWWLRVAEQQRSIVNNALVRPG